MRPNCSYIKIAPAPGSGIQVAKVGRVARVAKVGRGSQPGSHRVTRMGHARALRQVIYHRATLSLSLSLSLPVMSTVAD